MEIAKKIPSAPLRETDEMMATSRPPGAGVLFRFFYYYGQYTSEPSPFLFN